MTDKEAAEVLVEIAGTLAKKGEFYPRQRTAITIACGVLMVDEVLKERIAQTEADGG